MARLIQHMAGRIFFICGCFIGSLTYAQQNAIDSLETALKTVVEDTIRVKILVNLSDVYLAFQPDKSRSYAEEAVELSKKLDYPRGEGMALSHLGDYQFRQGKYAKAVEFASQSLHIAEKMQDSVLMAEAYRVLGNINNIGLKRYDSAFAYQLKALHIHQRQKNYENIASICGSITWIYATTTKT